MKSYPLEIVQPLKDELLEQGFREFQTIQDIDEVLKKPGTTFIVVNSVCGCSARGARPSAIEAVQQAAHPDRLYTVFAGYDMEQLDYLRNKYFLPYPPSSPSMALFRDGKLVHFVERRSIEGSHAVDLTAHLKAIFQQYCAH